MNISIRHLQHFIAVAEELHFRRAAQVSNVAQPALSRSIQMLENELGVQLLNRNNRNVKLTAAGVEFLAGAISVVKAMQTTIDSSIRADQTEFGGLNIGYTFISMVGKLPKLIAAFEQQYPDVSIEPVSGNSVEQVERLHRSELDCCFISGTVDDTATEVLDSVVFKADPYVVIVSHHHPLANNGAISVEQLAKETILLCGLPKDSTYNKHVLKFLANAGVSPTIEYVPQNNIGVLGRAALNRGICIETEGYGSLYSNELRTLKLAGIDAKLPTSLVWRRDIQSEAAIKFRDFALQHKQAETSSRVYSSAKTSETAELT